MNDSNVTEQGILIICKRRHHDLESDEIGLSIPAYRLLRDVAIEYSSLRGTGAISLPARGSKTRRTFCSISFGSKPRIAGEYLWFCETTVTELFISGSRQLAALLLPLYQGEQMDYADFISEFFALEKQRMFNFRLRLKAPPGAE